MLRPLRRWTRTPADEPPAFRIADAVDAALTDALDDRAVAGRRVALAIGSRALPNHAALARAAAESLTARGATVVVVPAMGSHGGDAAGQRAILTAQGITEDVVGAPIDASMETRPIGVTSSGIEIVWSAVALACDFTVLLNRVAPHPNLTSRIQSGLSKMSVIGLGKKLGTTRMHAAGVSAHIEAAAELVREATNFVGGLALVCDGDGRPVELTGIPAAQLPSKELELLARARALRHVFPFAEADVVILDWFGKNVSPTGIDRGLLGRGPNAADVRVASVVALALTDESRGNGLGVGFADAVTKRVVAAIDQATMRANAEGSGDREATTLPRVFDTDEDAVCWAIDAFGPRVVRIQSTANLRSVFASDGLCAEGPYVADGNATWQFGTGGELDLRAPWVG